MGKKNVDAVVTTEVTEQPMEQVVSETTEIAPIAQVEDDGAPVMSVSDDELANALASLVGEAIIAEPTIEKVSTAKVTKERKTSIGRALKSVYTRKGLVTEDSYEFQKMDFMDEDWRYRLSDSNQGKPGVDGMIRGFGYTFKGVNMVFFQNEDARAFADFLTTGVKPEKFKYIGPVELPEGKTAKEVWAELPEEMKKRIADRK